MPFVKTSELKRKTGLYFGLPNSGYYEVALEDALAAGPRVLVLAAAGMPIDPDGPALDVGSIQTANEAMDYLKDIKSTERYDAIILHGVFELLNLFRLRDVGDNQPSQPQWGQINWMVWRYLRDLTMLSDVVYATVSVTEDEATKTKSLAITPGLQALLVGMLNEKVFVSQSAQGKTLVQRGGMALRFIPPASAMPSLPGVKK